MAREFFEHSVDELEKLFKENLDSRPLLARLKEELGFRKTERASQLRKEIDGILDETVPKPPKPLRPDSSKNQEDLDL